MRLLILGAGGFIGSNLIPYLLANRDYHITGFDLRDDKIKAQLKNPRFTFKQGDMTKEAAWIEEHIKACDVVLPFAAIANPATYVKDPLSVFELDFEANLAIVKLCAKHQKRIIFPSTSEVYGMSADLPYDEETSNLTTGPIVKERWIYSTSKQMMDRVIYAYGAHRGLNFTLFRPFNWFGPGLDDVLGKDNKSSRVVSKFLGNIIHRKDITLIGGGGQKRCFLYIDDAIEALTKIIDNKNDAAIGRIFNIGSPDNECSIEELAALMLEVVSEFKGFENIRSEVKIVTAKGEDYYGKGYQDVSARVPKIENAKKYLGWKPATGLKDAIRKTVEYYVILGGA